jgi:hypothetical protein
MFFISASTQISSDPLLNQPNIIISASETPENTTTPVIQENIFNKSNIDQSGLTLMQPNIENMDPAILGEIQINVGHPNSENESDIVISYTDAELKLKFAPVDLVLQAVEGKTFNSLTFVEVPSTEIGTSFLIFNFKIFFINN